MIIENNAFASDIITITDEDIEKIRSGVSLHLNGTTLKHQGRMVKRSCNCSSDTVESTDRWQPKLKCIECGHEVSYGV